MKRPYLIAILLILFSNSFACSCGGGKSFCDNHSSYDLTASFVIVDTFPNGISLFVIHRLYGNENKDTIKVWNRGGPYSMCNDSTSDARASYLGNVGDTLILALPKIDSVVNTWDIVGDYRTPGFQCDAYRLNVENNTVRGFISGSEYCYYLQNCLNSYNYDDFLADFPSKRLSCQTWLNTNELSAETFLTYYPNPASDNIIFKTPGRGMLTIANHLGQFVDAVTINNTETQISTTGLPSGIYFLTFQTEKNAVTRKLVVQK